jgi:hypothetical protein
MTILPLPPSAADGAYDARRGGHAKLWRDDTYLIPFGLLQPPLLVQVITTNSTNRLSVISYQLAMD